MATYLILNVCFIAAIMTLLRLRPRRPTRAWIIAFVALLILTATFDNLMIHFQLFTYASDKILGIHLGYAPIEDFFYAILAAIIIPALWHKYGNPND